MKTLPTNQFLDTVQKRFPAEFKMLTLLACEYVMARTAKVLEGGKNGVGPIIEAKGRFDQQLTEIVILGKAQSIIPQESIDPYQIINFLA